MKINNNWEIKADDYQIVLVESRVSTKDETKTSSKQTYHLNVSQALRHIVNKEIVITGLEDLKAISDCIDNLYSIISKIPVVTLEKIVYKEKKEVEGNV